MASCLRERAGLIALMSVQNGPEKTTPSCRMDVVGFHGWVVSKCPPANGKQVTMKKRTRNRRMQLQQLVKRELMAGDISLSGNVLKITGTNSEDTAYVSYSGKNVKATLNGKSELYAKSKVKQILFRGYDRDDYFKNRTSIPTKAYGHDGNDKLYGGSGNDYLSGGDGRDTLSGSGGHDSIYGGTGNDKLYGGSGNDYMAGYTGNDTLSGGSGNDHVRGNAGNDTLYGGDDNDTLRGFSGNDKLYGGDGNDYLYGGDNNDHLEGDAGNDRLYGESGHDDLYGEGGVDYLSGGSGRDGLYGGGSTSKDTLRGGSDSDRFIIQSGDKIVDYSSANDVQLKFVNGSANWNNSEIETADQAFRKLHHKTKNVKLLKDPFTNQTLVFRKESQAWMTKNYKSTTLGVNSTNHQQWKTKTWNYVKFKWDHHHHERRSRIILLKDWNNSSSSERNRAVDTVLHEIAHNWDASRPGESHKQWSSFKKLHDKSKSKFDYVSGYAKTSALEDWSETFAHYVTSGTKSSNAIVRQKLAVVDAFFKAHA